MARHFGIPDTLIHFGVAPGDDLLCTAVLRELKKRGSDQLWMMSNYPEIFGGNSDATRVVPVEERYRKFAVQWRVKYHTLDYGSNDFMRDMTSPPTRHIIGELCLRVGIKGEIKVRPYFHLHDDERTNAEWATGSIAIQSCGLSAKYPMQNKQWFPQRFQAVVNQLKSSYKFVQLGAASDPALSGATDLRGKTSIREVAAVLSNCRLFVGSVGFLMHLARAVECRSVIIYGGREAPWQSGYSCNINLYSPVPCAPCWFWNRCDHDRECMQQISPNHVIEAINEAVRSDNTALKNDSIHI
jgi:hypothetical protein